jgi:Xaa-Pro dipeptidase
MGNPPFQVNGKFTEEQRIIYEAVLDAQKAVIGAMRPGASWVDMHKYSPLLCLGACFSLWRRAFNIAI